jgi:DNA-binding response OmpR family regulator
MQRRALIVDDEPALCDFIQSMLGSTGMSVLSLTNSKEAESSLRDEKFTVALFDLRMPAPDGIELTRQARASGINQMTPIILVSDDQSNAAVSQGFAAGASFFLYKPIDKARLLKLVRATQGVIEHERRRFRRVSQRSKVLLGFDKRECECETIDMSLNGMLVAGPGDVLTGSVVRVNLYLTPGMKPIVGTGIVVRVLGGNQMGIQLSQFTTAESGRLQDFLLPLILKEGLEANVVNV